MTSVWGWLLLLAAISGLVLAPAAHAGSSPSYKAALDAATRDLCGSKVAMLGEATHGDGVTVAFKAALIERLVVRCRFNAVFFEASHYDFIALDRMARHHEAVTPELLKSAVGGMWRYDQEIDPLMHFLSDRARRKQVMLGGLDDQLGVAGSFYANDTMPAELTIVLAEPRRNECRQMLRRRIYWDFGGDYTSTMRDQLRDCVVEMKAATAQRPATSTTGERLQMLASIDRQLSRDLANDGAYIVGRDRSMFLNFEWLIDRLPPSSKIIVWSASAHVAADGAGSGDYAEANNLGRWVKQLYGDRAHSLGFSALSGRYRYSRGEPARAFPTAAPDSLESSALGRGGEDTVFVGRRALRRLGTVPGFLFGYDKPVTFAWARAFDGVVVFREQRPPVRTDTPSVKK